MRDFVDGFGMAFSLFSILPAPRARWDSGSMRYALCFVPLVGVVFGALLLMWFWLCRMLSATSGLFAAVAVAIPLLFSGGVHMKGFVTAIGALSSRDARADRLEALSDSTVGASGAIGCTLYLLVSFGLWQQVYTHPALLVLPAAGLTLSRALGALSVARLPCAESEGLVYMLHNNAEQAATTAACILFVLAASAVVAVTRPVMGLALFAWALLCYALYRRLCLREFGGGTEALAGFLQQLVELGCLVLAIF